MSSEKVENKICQNCKKDFVIEPDDFGFYEKIKVPPPTFCPECRLIRRLSWRNERGLHNRECGLCGKKIISIYNKDLNNIVYCNKCWWGELGVPRNHVKVDLFASQSDTHKNLFMTESNAAWFYDWCKFCEGGEVLWANPHLTT